MQHTTLEGLENACAYAGAVVNEDAWTDKWVLSVAPLACKRLKLPSHTRWDTLEEMLSSNEAKVILDWVDTWWEENMERI